MKRSIASLNPVYNTGRMVAEYATTCYVPSAQRYSRLTADNLAKARSLAQWRQSLMRAWNQVRVENVEATGADPLHVGGQLEVKARVSLGNLSPNDVEVQLFHGIVDSLGEIPQPHTVTMSHNGDRSGNSWIFKGTIPCRTSGQHGYAVRVLPKNGDLANALEPGLVCWG